MSKGVQLQQEAGVLKPAGRSVGWVRIGEAAVGRSAVNFLMVHADSDAAEDFVAGLNSADVASVVWSLDLQASRNGRRRRKEIDRLIAAGKKSQGPWVAVVPFVLPLARDLQKRGKDARFAILSDDLAAIWSGGEAAHASSLSALKESASAILDVAMFMGSCASDRILVSTRKAKEFPGEALAAVLHFFEMEIDKAKVAAGASLLGRQQPLAPRVVAPQIAYQPAFKWGVDSIFKRGIVCGWVKRAMSNERIAVKVLVDGQEAATGKAEFFRQQLFDLGVGDGSHSFAIDISASLGSTPKRVEIRTVDGNVLLGEAMMTASVGRRVDETAGVELAS